MSKKTQVTNTLKVNRDLNEKITRVNTLERDLQARNNDIAILNTKIQEHEQQSQQQQALIKQMTAKITELNTTIAQRIERQVIIDTLKELRLMSEFDFMHTAVSRDSNTLTDYTIMLKDKWSREIRKLFNEKTQFVTTAVVGSEISIPVAHRINYDIQEEAPNRQIDTAVYRVLSQGFMLGDTVIEKARVTRIDPL